jgi:hypothetical protein
MIKNQIFKFRENCPPGAKKNQTSAFRWRGVIIFRSTRHNALPANTLT